MSANVINQVPYLRTSRNFPEDSHQLTVEVNKTYVDIANAVNLRTIGLFTVNNPTIGGESWFLSKGQKQQNLREVFAFSNSNLTITHNINFNSLTNFVRIWGTFFDGTNWWPLPYVDVVNANNQINVKVNKTQIVITKGAGSPPVINNGLIVLEWISNV